MLQSGVGMMNQTKQKWNIKNGDLMVCAEMPVDTWLVDYLRLFGVQVGVIEPKYLKKVF